MTSTALDLNHHAASAALAVQPGQIAWDAMQLAALDQLGLKDASDGDRAVFLHVCQSTGLDPFARQIYMIPRNEKIPGTDQWRKKWTIQTGIDGFRVNRDRAERKAGMRGVLGRAVFYDPDGNEHKVWVQPRPPVACEITYTVKDRDGNATPYTSVLRFTEYCQADSSGNLIAQWKTKPAHMLEKCTEADVYRKAFPQDFSGIYLDDAMPPDAAPADGTPGGRPRGRVTAGEVIGRGDTDGQEAPPRTERRGKAAGNAARGQRKAGADPSPPDGEPGAHLPPPPGDDDDPGAHLAPGEAAEFGTERHAKVVGVVWQHLQRLGYPAKTKESDEDKARRLADVARLAGVAEIGSTSDLDLGELSLVADALARCKNRDALDALLKAGEVDD